MAPLDNKPPSRPRREPIERPNLPAAAVDVFCFHKNNGIESTFIFSASMSEAKGKRLWQMPEYMKLIIDLDLQ